MIDIKKVREKAQAQSSEARAPRMPVVDDTWQEAHAALVAVFSATTKGEFDRREPTLPRAYRRLYDRARAHKGDLLRDPALEEAIRGLIELWEQNPLFHDQARFPRPYAVGSKIIPRLARLLVFLSNEFLIRHPVDKR
jgi:hypothetical protein